MSTSVRFGTVRPYLQNINRCVQITMTRQTTFRTFEFPLFERKIDDSSAFVTSLARVIRVDSYDFRTACYSFVFQVHDESTPRNINYVFADEFILNHLINFQILDSNERISIDNFSTQLMKKVRPLIVDFQIFLCKSDFCFSFVGRTLLLSDEFLIQYSQLFFTSVKVSRIQYRFSIGECCKIFESDIDADLLFRGMNYFAVELFTAENSKPLTSSVLLDCHGFHFSFWNSMQNNWNISYMSNMNFFVGIEPCTRLVSTNEQLRESNASNMTLESGESLLLAGFVFYSAKEIFKRFVQSHTNISDYLRMCSFSSLQIQLIISSIEGNPSISPRIYAQCKQIIVNFLAGLERINQSDLLLSRGINTIDISSEFHRGW